MLKEFYGYWLMPGANGQPEEARESRGFTIPGPLWTLSWWQLCSIAPAWSAADRHPLRGIPQRQTGAP